MPQQNGSPYAFEKDIGGSIQSSALLVPIILELTGPIKSVVDIGGGTGAWLREFQRAGVPDVRLFDSRTVEPHLVVPRECFTPLNLENELPGPTRADLAISLEFAEHVTKDRSEPLVHWLTSTADIVLFSAATIGQGGTFHVNEQFPIFWLDLFRARGFKRRDVIRERIIKNPSIEWWYRQNMFFFVKDGCQLATTADDFLPEEFSIIYRNVEISREHPRLKTLLRQLLPAFSTSVKTRLNLKRD